MHYNNKPNHVRAYAVSISRIGSPSSSRVAGNLLKGIWLQELRADRYKLRANMIKAGTQPWSGRGKCFDGEEKRGLGLWLVQKCLYECSCGVAVRCVCGWPKKNLSILTSRICSGVKQQVLSVCCLSSLSRNLQIKAFAKSDRNLIYSHVLSLHVNTSLLGSLSARVKLDEMKVLIQSITAPHSIKFKDSISQKIKSVCHMECLCPYQTIRLLSGHASLETVCLSRNMIVFWASGRLMTYGNSHMQGVEKLNPDIRYSQS